MICPSRRRPGLTTVTIVESSMRRAFRPAITLAIALALAGATAHRSDNENREASDRSNRAEATTPRFDFPLDSPPSDTTRTGVAVLGIEQGRGDIEAVTTTTAEPAPSLTSPPTTPPTTTTTAPPPATTSTSLPTTTTTTPASVTPEDRGLRALDRISYDWANRLPGWTVTFSPGRNGVFGYTYVSEQRIEIFVRDSMSDALLAHVVAHELGHAVDVTLNSGDDRAAWADARSIGTVQWWPGDGVTDFSTGAGDFAESFAVWQVGGGNYRGRAAGLPSAEQLSLLSTLANG